MPGEFGFDNRGTSTAETEGARKANETRKNIAKERGISFSEIPMFKEAKQNLVYLMGLGAGQKNYAISGGL